MKKTIILKLTTIRYTGDSIGNDIHIDGEIFGKKFSFTKNINRGETVRIDAEIGKAETDNLSLAVPLTVQVTEKDLLFPDVGKKTETMIVDVSGERIQNKVITVEVREKKLRTGKRKALFDITCEATIQKNQTPSFANKSIVWWEEWKPIKQYSYRGINGKEDYNRYDPIIKSIVAKWNKEFCDDFFPPGEPLDPNLVKAMIYIESRMGYFQSNDYPAYPDIMQVADVRNPAIHTLNNDGWKDKSGARAQEREWNKGKVSILNYRGKANGASPEKSIRWGVRWLYHCVQGITYENIRYWRSWKKAVGRYNGEGNKTYTKEVFGIYTNGIDARSKPSVKLFVLSVLALALLGGVSFGAYAFHVQERIPKISEESFSSNEGEGSDPEIIEKKVRELIDENMMAYKRQDDYYYGETFREPFLLCKRYEETCFADLIFPSYLDQFLRYAKNMISFREVVESLEISTPYNSFYDDFDNDGKAELGMVLTDNLNHEYLDMIIVDHVSDSFHTARTKIKRPYSGGPPRILDLTGDAIPEIVVFSSGGRQDVQAYVFQYSQGELKRLLSLERGYLRADIIFTDQNNNHLPEIKVKGEQYGDECMACEHKKIEEFFEYNPRSERFRQIK